MTDERRRFALRENGGESSVFTGKNPRQAALKAARRLDSSESEEDAMATSEQIYLREHGTVDIHIYDAWAWESDAPDTSPDWLGEKVTQANVSKVDVRRTTKSEDELQYDSLEPLLVDQPIDVTKDECEQCGQPLDDSYLSATPVRDIPSIVGEVTYMRYRYECSSCGERNSGEHPNCSEISKFGVNALSQAVLLYYEYRLPQRAVSRLFNQLYDYDINHASVMHARDYLFPAAQSEYKHIHNSIKDADVLHIDETQFPVDGDKYWLWGFTTGDKTLYALRESRGSVVLEEILGESFNGIIVCDGWTGYSAYHSHLQRCWAHLLREKDNLSENDTEALALYEKLQDLHNGLNTFLDSEPTLMQRITVQQQARELIDSLIAEGAESKKALDLLQTLQGGLGHWFTFVTYPKVRSTNNQAERVLRDSVIRRKTMTLRAQKGVNAYETFQSLIRTWKQQERNPYTELQRLARQIGRHHTDAENAWD
jgi:transposase